MCIVYLLEIKLLLLPHKLKNYCSGESGHSHWHGGAIYEGYIVDRNDGRHSNES